MKNTRRLLEHILFWTMYWLFMSLSGGLYDFDFVNTALYNLTQMPLTIAATYLFVYRILPFYFAQKILLLILWSALAFAIFLFLRRLSMQYIQFPLFYSNSDYTFKFFDWYRIVGSWVNICGSIGIVAGFKYYRDWKRTREKVDQLSHEKREAELSFLKAQIHPHFLFNTLNSIYYEALRKSDQAPDLIIRLSEMLRYTLHECRDEYIPIAKEVELLRNFVALEKSRYGSRLEVIFEVEAEDSGKIPPLVCFSLVENAFKHGASQSKDQCLIEILLRTHEDQLSLSISNPVSGPGPDDGKAAIPGIGLKNVTRQLDLIFGEDYHLSNAARDGRHFCNLQIPLMRP